MDGRRRIARTLSPIVDGVSCMDGGVPRIRRDVAPGRPTLDIPPLERREPDLKRLPSAQRERIESPEFYELLQRTISACSLEAKPPG